MTLQRSELKITPGEHKTDGVLIQTTMLPNGNYLCLHSVNRREAAVISVYDPVNKKTIAKSTALRFGSGFVLLPFSDDHFIFYGAERRDGPYHRLHIDKDKIVVTSSHQVYGWPNIYFSDANTLIVISDYSVASLNAKGQISKRTGERAAKYLERSHALPSGKIVTYKIDEQRDLNEGQICIYNNPEDRTPIQTIRCKFLINSNHAHHGVAFSETVVAYDIKRVDGEDHKILYCIHNLKTDAFISFEIFAIYDRKLVFTKLPDDKTLICNGYDFFVLDNQTMTLSPVNLGRDNDNLCTGVCYDQGYLAITFKADDVLYISDAIKPGIDYSQLTLLQQPVTATATAEQKAEAGAYKTHDVLYGVAVLPNGNFVWSNRFTTHDNYSFTYFVIFDPVNKKAIAKSRNAGDVAGSLIPVSSDAFVVRKAYSNLERFCIHKKEILFTGSLKQAGTARCERAYLVGNENKKLLGAYSFMLDDTRFVADPVSLEIIQKEEKDAMFSNDCNWNPLPSGKIVNYFSPYTENYQIRIYNDLFDKKPVRTLAFQKQPGEMVGVHAVAFSESVVAYSIGNRFTSGSNFIQPYVIRNLDTEQSVRINFRLSKYNFSLIHTELPDNRILFCSGGAIFAFDVKEFTWGVVDLGFATNAACTGLAFDPIHNLLAVTLEDEQVLYISDGIKPNKEVEDVLLDAVDTRITRPLVKIINGYRGLRLFQGKPEAREFLPETEKENVCRYS